MNVFNSRVTVNKEIISFAIDGGILLTYPANELSSEVRALLGVSPNVVIGIRPHAFRIGEGAIRGTVMSCQWLGDQTHVAVDVGGKTAVSVAHDRVSKMPGSDLSLSVAASDLHFFDPTSGNAIAHGSDLA